MADEPGRNGTPPAASEAVTFEQAYAELEQTAQALQQGQLSLDETLRLYERGSFLARYCLEKLDGVELKVTQLLAHVDGSYSTKPIVSEKDVSLPPAPAAAPSQPRSDAPDEHDLFSRGQKELFD